MRNPLTFAGLAQASLKEFGPAIADKMLKQNRELLSAILEVWPEQDLCKRDIYLDNLSQYMYSLLEEKNFVLENRDLVQTIIETAKRASSTGLANSPVFGSKNDKALFADLVRNIDDITLENLWFTEKMSLHDLTWALNNSLEKEPDV